MLSNSNIFLISAGLGFGNASRQIALCEALRDQNYKQRIVVFSWGKGIELYNGSATDLDLDVIPILSFFPTALNAPYAFKMLFAFVVALPIYFLNSIFLLKQILRHRPKAVVFDSDYHFLPFLLFPKIKRLSVNQAPYVLLKSRRYLKHLKANYFFSFIIEYIDSKLQSLFCHSVFVPCIEAARFKNSKLISIPLFARKIFLKEYAVNSMAGSAAFLSGSGIEKKRIQNWATTNNLKVWSGEIDKRKFLKPYPRYLDYKHVFIQAGLSSIGECLALKRNISLLPIKNHWEQFVNAKELERLYNCAHFHTLPAGPTINKLELSEQGRYTNNIQVNAAQFIARKICFELSEA